MLTRICRIVAVTSAVLLAVIGVLTYPSQLLVMVVTAVLLVGPLTAVCVFSANPFRGVAVQLTAAAAAAVIAISLVVAGLVALLGGVATPVVALLLVAGGTWTWRRRTWWGRAFRLDTSRLDDPRPDPGSRRTPRSTPGRMPVVHTGFGSTTELRASWQRTYWLLRDLPPTSPDRGVVVDLRRQLLDEIERRDPDGFTRWMQTEPRAGSDPGRYLIDDR